MSAFVDRSDLMPGWSATMSERWTAAVEGQYVEVERRGGSVYLEDGPAAWPARGHEGHGGTFTFEEVRRRTGFFDGYPGFREEILADMGERYRAVDASWGVLCTIGGDVTPRATPCRFVIEGDVTHVPMRAPDEVLAAADACLLVTSLEDDAPPWWARFDGVARVLETGDYGLVSGPERLRDKYPQIGDEELADILEITVTSDVTFAQPSAASDRGHDAERTRAEARED